MLRNQQRCSAGVQRNTSQSSGSEAGPTISPITRIVPFIEPTSCAAFQSIRRNYLGSGWPNRVTSIGLRVLNRLRSLRQFVLNFEIVIVSIPSSQAHEKTTG